eukprot:gb/GECG01000550.1/.p1 GENE.gb/GECG01000550.1/~~gb/GECG01000550.1/.p1  ORF type:complete len:130 (+),score=9.45 gb/GECG01000550.1/:1-390(+)
MLNCNAVHKQKPLSVREYDTMRAGLLKILLFAASIHAVHATIGVSFSTRSPGSHEWTIEDLKCAKQHGATVSIPRCYFSGNTTNEDCAKSIIDCKLSLDCWLCILNFTAGCYCYVLQSRFKQLGKLACQ